MLRVKNTIIALFSLTAVIAVVAAVIPTTTQGHGGGQEKDVNVVNTPNVKVTNTPSVNVANSPIVRAQQNGLWNVGITGNPTVQAQQNGLWNVGISGTPNVLVGNTEAAPVFVRDVDRPTAQAFQQEIDVTIPDGGGGENAFITVPAGKMLVIEQVSATGEAPAGQTLSFSVGSRILPDNIRRHHRLLAVKEEGLPNSFFVASQQLRIYAEAIASVRLARVGSTGTATATFVVSGYFVDK